MRLGYHVFQQNEFELTSVFSYTYTKEDAVMVNHCKDLSLHQAEFPINYFILIQLFIAEWYKL